MFSSIYLQELAILVKNAPPVEASTPEVVRKGSVCVAYVSFVYFKRATVNLKTYHIAKKQSALNSRFSV